MDNFFRLYRNKESVRGTPILFWASFAVLMFLILPGMSQAQSFNFSAAGASMSISPSLTARQPATPAGISGNPTAAILNFTNSNATCNDAVLELFHGEFGPTLGYILDRAQNGKSDIKGATAVVPLMQNKYSHRLVRGDGGNACPITVRTIGFIYGTSVFSFPDISAGLKNIVPTDILQNVTPSGIPQGSNPAAAILNFTNPEDTCNDPVLELYQGVGSSLGYELSRAQGANSDVKGAFTVVPLNSRQFRYKKVRGDSCPIIMRTIGFLNASPAVDFSAAGWMQRITPDLTARQSVRPAGPFYGHPSAAILNFTNPDATCNDPVVELYKSGGGPSLGYVLSRIQNGNADVKGASAIVPLVGDQFDYKKVRGNTCPIEVRTIGLIYPTGSITIKATNNGRPWDAPLFAMNYTGPKGTLNATVDPDINGATFADMSSGAYSINAVTPPVGFAFASVNGGQLPYSMNLSEGGALTITFDFVESVVSANGTIVVQTKRDGVFWDSPDFTANYTGPGGTTDAVINTDTNGSQTLGAVAGTYTVNSVSAPAGLSLASITPSFSQILAPNGTITFTLNFTTSPPAPGTIIVRTVKDGVAWNSPLFTANYTGPGGTLDIPIDTDASGQQVISAAASVYTVNRIFALPSGVTFQNINGSSLPYSQTLSAGGTLTFTLNFTESVSAAVPDVASFINSFSAPIDGASIVFAGGVENVGSAVSGATTAHWTIDGISLGNRSVPGLGINVNHIFSSDSWTATKGRHSIQLCTDTILGETNTSNNCIQFSFGVLPDLVARLDAISGVGVGVPFVFSGAVENSTLTAKASADSSNARFRVGKCAVVRGRVRCSLRDLITVIGLRPVGALAIGASQAVQSDSWTPTEAGEYVAELCADYDLRIDEISDRNNCTPIASGRFIVGGTPPPAPACSDGIDNDGDGLIDFPADSGCISANDADEANAPLVPATPTLRVDASSLLTCGSIGLRWDAVPGATDYEIDRVPAGAGFPRNVGNVLSWSDTSIAQGANYNYRLRAHNSFGYSAYSASASASNDSPRADFSFAPAQPRRNQAISFTDTSLFFGASRQSRLWQFSGGLPPTATTSPAQTRFSSSGRKTIGLRIVDTASRSCLLEKTVTVRAGFIPPGWEEVPPT